eukprot:5273239-Amphidinium_carterae.1
MPGLVTILCHAECLGAWTSFWAPCRGLASKLRAKFTARVKATSTNVLGTTGVDLVSRSDICSYRWNMDRRECTEAVMDRLAWL